MSRVTLSRQPQLEELTSTKSSQVARLRALHRRKGRLEYGTFLAEGPECVEAALRAGVVTRLLARPGHDCVSRASEAGVPVRLASDRVITAVSDTRSPQGVVAECRLPSQVEERVWASAGPMVVADGVADPGNLGSIIRTVEAVGGVGLAVTAGSVDPWNPKSVRASVGSVFRLPIHVFQDALVAAASAHDSGRICVALAGDGEVSLGEGLANMRRAGRSMSQVAWLVGSEAHGLSKDVLGAADVRVRLPMRASVESLNASVSVAVALYLAAAMDEGWFEAPISGTHAVPETHS